MRKSIWLAVALATSAVPMAQGAMAQDVATARPIAGTRLDITATGIASRVPDLALISAGVQSLKPTASAAIEDTAARMGRVLTALKRAGIADKDIQTSSVSLNPEYRYDNNQPPVLTGYRASNTLSVRFHDLKRTGSILDALVAEGANQISGPNLTVDHPEAAYDEARMKAVAAGRARADLYARALGMRVVRVISVSEGGNNYPRPPMPMMAMERSDAAQAKTSIEPGTQDLEVNVAMVFELQ